MCDILNILFEDEEYSMAYIFENFGQFWLSEQGHNIFSCEI